MKIDSLEFDSCESTLVKSKNRICSKLWYFFKLMMIGSFLSIVLSLLLVFLTSKKGHCLPRFSLIVQRKYIDGCLNDGLYGSERSCDEYYRCKDGIPIPEQCEFGLEWSTLNNTCVSRQKSDCSRLFYCPSSFGKFRNELHCDTFYVCFFNQPYLIYCPPPLLFSSVSKDCEWPEDSDCAPPLPKITTTTSTTTSTTPKSTTTEESITVKPYDCPNADGFFPDPDDCTAYFYCEKNIGTKMHCSKGKGFNSKYLSCNEPEDSDCAKRKQK